MSMFFSLARAVGDGLAAIAGIHNLPPSRDSHASAALSIQEMGQGPPRTKLDIAKVYFLLSSPNSPLRRAGSSDVAATAADDGSLSGSKSTQSHNDVSVGLPALPPEVVSLILDFAEYYLCKVSFHFAPTTFLDNANELYFRTPPLRSALEVGFLRRIEFRIVSHDQGFSAEPAHMQGTKEGSWTWWEVTLDRPALPPLGTGSEKQAEAVAKSQASPHAENHLAAVEDSTPAGSAGSAATSRRSSATSSTSTTTTATTALSSPASESGGKQVWFEELRYEITRNFHAVRRFNEHIVTFGPDHPLVQHARRGDSLGIWARTRYPAWRNHAKEVEVKVWMAT